MLKQGTYLRVDDFHFNSLIPLLGIFKTFSRAVNFLVRFDCFDLSQSDSHYGNLVIQNGPIGFGVIKWQ